ncbi:FecCD family ABC transporter permease [Pseudoroseicyclus aestuarii]|uniref:Iron complex transport system permease protein n=1 Tax=Pseudoroseicyclus aestuarii TaxID=1795041 RepID=A0A318SZT4_9RHOB|nr:iron ABC transporter permease [Pseudoroseicyclus aestuarii]PYE82327.1 iron complex transport system permease protein [Pseudoroseicyclus aestuarii]
MAGAARIGWRRGTTRTPAGARLGWLALLALALLAAALAALAVGARPVPPGEVLQALLAPDPGNPDHTVVRALRLPRMLTGLAVGAALAVAGVLMQAVTRNPLADPGLLGVNAGASFAVVLAIWLFGITDPARLAWIAFPGAGAVAALVYALGSAGRGAATPLRLALAGAALTALLLSLITAVLLTNQQSLDTYRYWVVGSLAGPQGLALAPLLPAFGLGAVLALWAASALNAAALGDEAAVALGVRLGWMRAGTLGAVTLLCGAAVAAAGPIGFVGLVVPHLVRAAMGPDTRACVLAAALAGPALLLAADVLGRVILPPGEVQVGIMTALIGAPIFILIVRRMRVLAP